MRMTAIARATALGVTLAVGACAEQRPMATPTPAAQAPAHGAQTGSMQYPSPQPGGQFTRPAPTRTDTGSMMYPNVGRPGYTTTPTTRAPQTGSMQYPAVNPAGALPPKAVH